MTLIKQHNRFIVFISVAFFTFMIPSFLKAENNQNSSQDALKEIQALLDKSEIVSRNDLIYYFKSNAITCDSSIMLAKQAQQLALSLTNLDDTVYASILNQIGYSYYCKMDYTNGLIYLDSALNIRQKYLDKKDIRLGETYHYLYLLHNQLVNRELFPTFNSNATHIIYSYRNSKNILAAKLFFHLGIQHKRTSLLKLSEISFKEVLKIFKNCQIENNSIYFETLQQLGIIYLENGLFHEAETLIKKSIALKTKYLGENHQSIAYSLLGLAEISIQKKDYQNAISLYERSIRIFTETYGSKNYRLSFPYVSLSKIYQNINSSEKSYFYVISAINVIENKFGKNNVLHNFGIVRLSEYYSYQGECQKADSLYNEFLNVDNQLLNRTNRVMAKILNILGNNYFCLGQYTKAESCFIETKRIMEENYFNQYPGISKPIRKLAQLNVIMNDYPKSITFYEDLLHRRKSFIRNIFSGSSETDKLNWLNQYPLFDNSLFSFALIDKTEESIKLALEMTLTAKAAVNDAIAVEKEVAFCSTNDTLQQKIDQLKKLNTQISKIAINAMKSNSKKSSAKKITQLLNKKEILEAELSKMCEAFKEDFETKNFDISSIASAIPKDAILCEYIKFYPYEFDMLGTDKERNALPKYLVFTLDHNNNISLHDLGSASIIDSLIITAREEIENAKTLIYTPQAKYLEGKLGKITNQLFKLLIQPIEKEISKNKKLLVSLDGILNVMPFDIFKNNENLYLIEQYQISYLSTGRDILKFSNQNMNNGDAVLFADPNFNLAVLKEETKKRLFSPTQKVSFRDSKNCLDISFPQLSYSRQESEKVAQLLRTNLDIHVVEHYGDDALESKLKAIDNPPRILHLSTHGYFCGEHSDTKNELKTSVNPILNSGLVFAGANTHKENNLDDDGILTGYEASGLNLVGTELVTLAACQTGVGEYVNGEGVFGLRRAFQQAGAKSILMSLWSIPDKKTSELMTNFYQIWIGGKSKSHALRESALKILHNSRELNNHSHPYLWGGFILLGNPN